MRDGTSGRVRVLGDGGRRGSHGRRPPRIALLAAIAVVAVAWGLTSLARMVAAPRPVQVDLPELPTDETAATTTPLLPPAIADLRPLVVDGFSGRLLMTVVTSTGPERWEWVGGQLGPLRSPLEVDNLYDIRLDAAGESIAATERFADEPPNLFMGDEEGVEPVFWGAHSFAWHAGDPGRIAWIARLGERPVTIHTGFVADRGVYFRPTVVLPDIELDGSGGVRLVAYDRHGFVLERWEEAGRTAFVRRVASDGTIVDEVEGLFVAAAPDGTVAVGSLDETDQTILYDSGLTLLERLQPAVSTLRWSPDGTGLATARGDRPSVVQIRVGEDSVDFNLALERAAVEAWSPDGRFLIVSGAVDGEHHLGFIEVGSGRLSLVPLGAAPVSVIATG